MSSALKMTNNISVLVYWKKMCHSNLDRLWWVDYHEYISGKWFERDYPFESFAYFQFFKTYSKSFRETLRRNTILPVYNQTTPLLFSFTFQRLHSISVLICSLHQVHSNPSWMNSKANGLFFVCRLKSPRNNAICHCHHCHENQSH